MDKLKKIGSYTGIAVVSTLYSVTVIALGVGLGLKIWKGGRQ